jgi:hypothetical protein
MVGYGAVNMKGWQGILYAITSGNEKLKMLWEYTY